MSIYSLYREESGIFTGVTVETADPLVLEQNTPAGCQAIAGQFAHLSQRVDLDLLAARQAASAPEEPVIIEGTPEEIAAAQAAQARRIAAAKALSVVVDYQPPAPQDTALLTWAWSADTKRWLSTPTPEAINADAVAAVKAERSRRLNETDWIITKSVELGTAISPGWRAYRLALRDVTLQPGYPFNVVWPTPPVETNGRHPTTPPT
jgi:hypothetical protein